MTAQSTLEPLTKFYKAEDYHQNYYVNNKSQPYCQMVIQPKMEKFEKSRLKKKKIQTNALSFKTRFFLLTKKLNYHNLSCD
jgi:peptide methionine sulfoxide reductase MsrA